MDRLDRNVVDAIIGIDTLWGGDVLNSSGTSRFIADSWFSDEPLPQAYTHEAAGRLRAAGGVAAEEVDCAAVDAYLNAVDVRGAIAGMAEGGRALGWPRGAFLEGLAVCFEVIWDLAQELLGRGAPVPYERCVRAATGAPPEPSDPTAKRERVAALVAKAGYRGDLLEATDAWRRDRMVPSKSIPSLSEAYIAHFDALTARHVMPHLPEVLTGVPRANIRFLPIENARFSGSMHYLCRERTPEGRPRYEATYQINAALQISVPEFQQLVSHEVVPGHVTTFAFLQDLFVRGQVGFEASVLTMNTRCAALFEGIANNAILMAHGVTRIEDLPDEDLQVGVLLARLQDDAKNQSSYLTWKEGWPREKVARVLREEYLCSEERSDKLSGVWGQNPLLGRMYLPAYRAGTERVAALRRRHDAAVVLPAIFGCRGLVDVVSVEAAV